MYFLKPFLIVFLILMSLGGAVNSGMTSFYFAIPFMIWLVYLSYKQGKAFLIVSIIFIILCIVISKTIDKNPFIFPVLSGGEVIVLKEGVQISYFDGSGSFTEYENIISRLPTKPTQLEVQKLEDFKNNDSHDIIITSGYTGNVVITKLKKGEIYKVIGIIHDGELGELVGIQTEVGQFASRNIDQDIHINKPIQSKWSKYLGNLMYWPTYPVLIFTLLISNLSSSRT